ncbi:O-antigen ligase family protein [Desulfonatronospira thiodismutans]|nr:O-antigen ligase family protein [Desulfonatronospira thiodismutans]
MAHQLDSTQHRTLLHVPARMAKLLHFFLISTFPQSSRVKRTDNLYLEVLGLGGLFLFLATLNLSTDLNRYGEFMLIAAFVLSWKYWGKILVKQPLFWLMIAFALSLVISTLIGMHLFPEVRHYAEARTMARFCLFVPIAWWIGTNPASIRNAFFVVCLFFTLSSMIWILDWNTLNYFLEGNRPERGMLGPESSRLAGESILRYASWTGMLLVGASVLGKDLLPDTLRSGKIKLLGYLVFSIIIVTLMLGTYVVQARGVWIAVLISLSIGLICRYCIFQSEPKTTFNNLSIPALICLMLVAMIALNFNKIQDRFLRDQANITNLLTGQIEEVQTRSVGYRVQMYLWTLEAEHSFFGKGARAIQAINDSDKLSQKYNWEVGKTHLHSDYLAILYRLGIIGMLIATSIFCITTIQIHYKYKKRMISPSFYVFFITATIYILIAATTNINIRNHAFYAIPYATFLSIILMSNE